MKVGKLIRLLFPDPSELDSVLAWRHYVLKSLLGILSVFGTIVAIPSMAALLSKGLWPMVLIDLLALAAVFYLWRSNSLPFKVQSWLLCVTTYALGCALLLVMGPISQIYLMVPPILAATLLGYRPALIALIVSTSTLFGLGYFRFAASPDMGAQFSPLVHWFTVALNFAFVNALLALSIAMLLRGLDKSIQRSLEASRAKSEFLANVSHEVRTPLHAILGTLELTQKTALTEHQADYLRKCDAAARNLLGIVNNVLDFSRIEADRMVMEPQDFTLDHLLRELALALVSVREQDTIRILLDVAPELPDRLHGDNRRIVQVLTHLGHNAIKFTSAGEVCIALANASTPETPQGSVDIRFSVSDTGIGIAPDAVARLFSGFAQADGTSTRQFGGLGLGLVISRNLVALMGGQLFLTSTPGQGTCLTFTLRLGCTNRGTSPHTNSPNRGRTLLADYLHTVSGKNAESHQRLPLKDMRVLVVEDNPVNQQVAHELLVSQGASVTLADNGALGVQAVRDTRPPFDVVLMDLQMPVMDGYAATRAIRAIAGCDTLPIIALTANALVSDRDACLNAGMNAHVSKPFELAALVVLLMRVTGRDPGDAALAASPTPTVPELRTAAIDLAPAMARLNYLTPLYLNAAQGFASAITSVPSQLQKLLAEGALEAARTLAHTYKSTAATLGLQPLSDLLADLERSCKDPAATASRKDLADTLATAVPLALEALQTAVALLKGTPAAEAPERVDHARLLPLLAQLQTSLTAEDYGALEVFASQRDALANAPAALVEQLEAALQNLDLAAALQAVTQLQDRCRPNAA